LPPAVFAGRRDNFRQPFRYYGVIPFARAANGIT